MSTVGPKLIFNLQKLKYDPIPKQEVEGLLRQPLSSLELEGTYLFTLTESWGALGKVSYITRSGNVVIVDCIINKNPSTKKPRFERLSDYGKTWFLHSKGLDTSLDNEI